VYSHITKTEICKFAGLKGVQADKHLLWLGKWMEWASI